MGKNDKREKKEKTKRSKGCLTTIIVIVIFWIVISAGNSSDSEKSNKQNESVDVTTQAIEEQAEQNITEEAKQDTMGTVDIEELKQAINEYLDSPDNKKNLKVIKKSGKDLVMSELSKIILEATQETYSADLSTFVTIRQCKNLYEQAFDESCPELDKNSELAEQLSDLYDEQENLKSLYPFNFEDGAAGYQLGEIYVTNRIEDKDAETITGMISQAVNSHNAKQWNYYDSKDDSYWAANNVEYNEFWGELPGEESYVILTNQKSPFSKSGVYKIAYYSDGRTVTTIDDRGFEAETPVLYLINETQLLADWDTYKDSKSKSERILAEIAQLNGGEEVSNSDPSKVPRGEIENSDHGENGNIEDTIVKRQLTGNYENGTYVGTAQGFGGEVTAVVVIGDGEIKKVELIGEDETPGIGGEALKELSMVFEKKSSANVDIIAGATVTSNAVIEAMQMALKQAEQSGQAIVKEDERDKNLYSVSSEDIFPTDWEQIVSWHSDSTGYYMIPEATDGNPVIYFSVENNTINASLAYGVLIDSLEQNEYGGLVCTGRMYPYTKSFGAEGQEEYNGMVEVTWQSSELIDFPSIRMIDGNQMTDTSMIADDYSYYGPIE